MENKIQSNNPTFFKEFHVTGVNPYGKRLKRLKLSSFIAANSINLYKGSVWGVKENNSRVLLKRVYN